MSRLRARCPDCRTMTAVALEGGEYECHSCGRTFAAGLVRVPRAWGVDGESMVEAAFLPLPYPEAAVVDEESLTEQNLALAAGLPDVPLVLGGCCCSHVGAVEGLATRYDRLAVIWFDAHGDLMPLRMLLDSGTVEPSDVALVGARNLDRPEVEFIAACGLHTGETGVERALEGADAVYVAFDVDVLDPDDDVVPFMPEPGGLTLVEAAAMLRKIAEERPLAGAGLTGVANSPGNTEPLGRLAQALGL